MGNGKRAVITGGSAGIGEAIARDLHRRGYEVHLIARREQALSRICEELNRIRNGSAFYRALDLCSREGLRGAEDSLRELNADLLVNNVGRGSFGYFDHLSADEEEQLTFLNCIVPLRLAHAAIPALKNKGTGGIIFISSIAGFQPLPFMATYAATKSFNLFQSLALRAELKPFGVKVLAVCPGPTATEFGGVARVPGSMTGITRDAASTVAKEALDAFERSSFVPFIVTGWRSKLIAAASRLTPVSFSTWLAARMLKQVLPGTPE